MAHDRRRPLHAAGRLAQLARIGLRHPRSRSRVLEFDRPHNSDGLISSLQAARGLPLLLSDQLLMLGGSVSPRSEFAAVGAHSAAVVGGRSLHPYPANSISVGIASEPYEDPDIAVDYRIAEKVLRHVGFLAHSEVSLATTILRQAVDDVHVDTDGDAAKRAELAMTMIDQVAGVRVAMSLSDSGHPDYACPRSPAAWTPTTAKMLAALWIQLLFGNHCLLRHLSQQTALPYVDEVWLTCVDGLRCVPTSAVSAGRDLIDAACGDHDAMERLIRHLHNTSGGAESAAKYAGAAERVVARSAAALRSLIPAQALSSTSHPELVGVDDPFATSLVIAQVVYVARVLDHAGPGNAGGEWS